MASCASMDFNCPVCLEVYKNPVVLSCSHSFCKACLENWWTEKIIRECPVCKRRSSKADPPSNLVLKNLCEAFSEQLTLGRASENPVPLCPQHKEKLHLFCVDHRQLVCLVCRDSRSHYRHKFRPIDEMAAENREQLRKSLNPLQDRLKMYSEVYQQWDQTSEHIKQQGQHTERLIQKQFAQMRAFLQTEEQARIMAVRTEVQQKSSLMEQTLISLRQEITALSQSIKQIEKELKAQDLQFLQNYSSTLRQMLQVPSKSVPELPPGSLVDVAKHLGNLGFNIWTKMKGIVPYTPVILDPNTAFKYLVVSDDLCSVHHTNTAVMGADEFPWVPDNPERFNDYCTVLGTEGFTSGLHSWEVNVHSQGRWAVGVIYESASRKANIASGYWEIWFQEDHYTAYAPPQINKVLTLKHPLQRIRVDLDMVKGKVSFSDAQNHTHIFTFFNTFSETVFPFLNTTTVNNIKISSSNATTTLKVS